jgi:hypothetical protein
MTRTPTLLFDDRRMWRRLVGRSHPDAGGDDELFIWTVATRDAEVLGEVPDGSAELVFRIACPWMREHTGGDRSGTRAGQYSNGALFFQCEHAHCAHRGWPEFRREIDPGVPAKIKVCRARRVWRRSS